MKPGAHLLAFGAARTFHRLACGLEDAGLEVRDVIMWLYGTGMSKSRHYPGGRTTTLKPAFEPVILARKPLAGTTEETIERFGTGALNTEACRSDGRHPADVVLGHEPECDEDGCAPGCAVALVDAEAASGRGVGRLRVDAGVRRGSSTARRSRGPSARRGASSCPRGSSISSRTPARGRTAVPATRTRR